MGGINGANHLKVESIPGHHASHHPLCAPNALGYMWDREKFDRDVAEGVACLACVRTLELDALKRQMGHAAAAYKPNFIVSDHHWMELNQALMIDEFQVYTAVVMARREMEQVNII
ncbi:MAG: hypothetical protein RSD49_06605, partial [Hafnia sp.]